MVIVAVLLLALVGSATTSVTRAAQARIDITVCFQFGTGEKYDQRPVIIYGATPVGSSYTIEELATFDTTVAGCLQVTMNTNSYYWFKVEYYPYGKGFCQYVQMGDSGWIKTGTEARATIPAITLVRKNNC